MDCVRQGTVLVDGRPVECWSVEGIERFSMEVSFEQVEDRLSQLPRMLFELDGSFVWRGEKSAASGWPPSSSASNEVAGHWQVDGMLYDVAGRVCRVELKGNCSALVFSQLVTALQPVDKLLAFCMNRGCFVRVDELLRAWNK